MEWDLGEFGLFFPIRIVDADQDSAMVEGIWQKGEERKEAFLNVENYHGEWKEIPRTLREISNLPWDNFVIEEA